MSAHEEESQHEVGTEVNEQHSAGEREDVFEKSGGDKHVVLKLVEGVFEDGESFGGFGCGDVEGRQEADRVGASRWNEEFVLEEFATEVNCAGFSFGCVHLFGVERDAEHEAFAAHFGDGRVIPRGDGVADLLFACGGIGREIGFGNLVEHCQRGLGLQWVSSISGAVGAGA